jgi:hypothetical protein
MKKFWIFGMIMLLFLAACAPAPEKPEEKAPPVEEKAPPMEEKAPEPEVGREPPVRPLPSERVDEGIPTPEPTEVVAPKVTMSPQLRDLLKRADEKLSSLQYLYGGTDTGNLFLDTYFVKGTKMKIKKYSEDYYVREGYYDTIYYDLGVGCCETQNRCKSHNVDNTGKKFDVDVTLEKIPKSPYQWIKEVPATAQIIGPQTFNQRSVTYIKYTDANGQQVEMWVDDTYGVPHKVIVGETVKHQFNDMLFNGLKDSDFDAPCD